MERWDRHEGGRATAAAAGQGGQGREGTPATKRRAEGPEQTAHGEGGESPPVACPTVTCILERERSSPE